MQLANQFRSAHLGHALVGNHGTDRRRGQRRFYGFEWIGFDDRTDTIKVQQFLILFQRVTFIVNQQHFRRVARQFKNLGPLHQYLPSCRNSSELYVNYLTWQALHFCDFRWLLCRKGIGFRYIVYLFRRQEAVGILQIDFLAQEHIEQIGVDMRTIAHELHDLQRFA